MDDAYRSKPWLARYDRSTTSFVDIEYNDALACFGLHWTVGEYGEIVFSGPQVALGYRNKLEETAHAMSGRRFHAGDIGFMTATAGST